MISSTEHADLPQGDLRLLDSPLAQDLLNSTELGRLGYIGSDGSPRVIPVGFVWNGTDVVIATFAGSPKLRALSARPDVAVTIDRAGPPPETLMIRGRIELDEVDGVPTEYREMQARYYGAEQAAAAVAGIEQSGARMVRMVLHPDWVGVIDFQTRFPGRLVEAGLVG